MLSKADFSVADAIRLFSQHSVEAAFLVPTATGLDKAIMDATRPFRDYLKQHGIHDYEGQVQGPSGKASVQAFYVTEASLVPTEASLYRPMAKGKEGDPRVWFSRLPTYASAYNLLAVFPIAKKLYVVNVSKDAIRKSASVDGSPLFELLKKAATVPSDVATELLDKLRVIARQGWIKTVTSGDTGIGATLEFHLGIKTNSRKAPDYKGIELKARRTKGIRLTNRSTLFAQVPDWKLSALKSSAAILDEYGYMRGAVKKLYCTVRSKTPNPQGLYFNVDEKADELGERFSRDSISKDVAIWQFPILRQALLDKHNETFWVAASHSRIGGTEHFQYERVKHTQAPFASNFHTLCDAGVITMDHLIKRDTNGRVREKGPLFKIDPKQFALLFPPPREYELLS